MRLPIGWRRRVDADRRAAVGEHESPRVEFRQRRMGVDAGVASMSGGVQACCSRSRPIGERRDGPRQSPVAVRLRQLARREIGLAGLRFGGAVAQHQMREIEIERMRRHIGALGHEAHVAERAGFDDLREIAPTSRRRLRPSGVVVDQIEQAREGIAQIEAAPAAMADVEDAPHLGIELRHVVEIGIFANRSDGGSALPGCLRACMDLR